MLKDIIVWNLQSDCNVMRPLGYPRKLTIDNVENYLTIFWKGEE